MSVPAERRYQRGRRCPICDGAEQDPRGAERRCFGFLSEDGEFAHCSREEHAGSIPQSPSETYAHQRRGPCRCGKQHLESEHAAEPPQSRIVAEYNYHDENGKLLYQVIRREPKAFAQRRPDPANPGRWVWGLEQDARRVLYHLDRVIEADPAATVYIVEGEKDVHALETLGLTATCNPQGALKFKSVEECAKRHLAGRVVCVIADADDRGRKHAADVELRLRGTARSIRVLELPGAKDAHDWVAAGGTSAQLHELVTAPPTAPTAPAIDVKADFLRTEKGTINQSQENVALAVAKLGVTVRYDMFANRILVDGLAGYGPHFDDTASNRLRLQIDLKFKFRIGKEFYLDVMRDQAHERRFHPVLDHLAALPRWDGVERLGSPASPSWLTRFAGAPDTQYTRAVGAMVLLAAVRRVRDPGCIYQELVILESPQGKNKSTALAILAGNREWFSDDYPIGADTRRMLEATMGRWILEAPELKGMSRSDVNVLKSTLSRTHDEARLAYDRSVTKVPRQYVAIGTTNETDGYLRDTTGNRRFLPVKIEEFDLTRLRSERDQLWSEVVVREAAGESIRLDPSLYAAASEEQEERTMTDPMDVVVCQFFQGVTGKVKMKDAWSILGIEGRTPTQDEMTRFGTAMKKAGWQRAQRRFGPGVREYAYVRGTERETENRITIIGKGEDAMIKPHF